LHVSTPEGAGIGVPASCSEQENLWPAPGLGLPDRSVPLSRRRMASGVPGLHFRLDLPPGPQFSFPDSSYGFSASTMSVETGPLSFAGNQFSYLDSHGHTAEPITPIDQIIHTPDFPPEVFRRDKRSTYQSRYVKKDEVFAQPMTSIPSRSSCDSHPCSQLFTATECGSSKPSPLHASRAQNFSFPSSPLASFHPGVQGASSCLVPLGPEGCQDVTQTQDGTYVAHHLPRRLSYPCDSRLFDSGLTSSAAYSCLPEEGDIYSTLGSLELASHAVIGPFFPSDFPCPASDSSPHTPINESATLSVHDGSISQHA